LFARIAYNWQLDYLDEPLTKNRLHKSSSTFLNPELSPQETELMISKFEAIYPDFKRRFKQEIQQLEFYIQYGYAQSDWKNNKNSHARIRLKSFLFKNIKAFASFFLSFFPYRFYEKFLFLYRRYVRRIPTY
jgi:hypothetical protein